MQRRRACSVVLRVPFACLVCVAAHGLALAQPTPLQASAGYGRMPAVFERNVGQAPEGTLFVARGRNATLHLTAEGAQIQIARPRPRPNAESIADRLQVQQRAPRPDIERASFPIRLRGSAAKPRVDALDPLPGKSHYLRGSDPAKWITDVPHYAKVAYRDVYPGIDQVFYGDRTTLEYDLVVKPGADPRVIELAFDTPAQLSDGNLVHDTRAGQIVQRRPVAYQVVGDARVAVEAEFVPTSTGAALKLGPYDGTRPLIVDPVIQYGTYLGGSSDDLATGVGVDAAGNAYIAGTTSSSDFPTVGSIMPNPAGLAAFVTKINASGDAIVWSTYVGGMDFDQATGITVTPDGTATIAGNTLSDDFPMVNAAQPKRLSTLGTSAFVSRLTPDGKGFVFSTYLGGSGSDRATAIAGLPTGEVFVTGQSGSANFPGDSVISNCKVPGMVFITKYGPVGDKRYSVCVGGTVAAGGLGGELTTSPNSISFGIAVDASGRAHVSGMTLNVDFPTVNAVQPQMLRGMQVIPVQATFALKLNEAGNALVYSTYVGGGLTTYGGAIAVDTAGNAYITGQVFVHPCNTYASPCDNADFPLENPILGLSKDIFNPFLVKIAPRGDKFLFATYLAVCGGGELWGKVAVDWAGNAYVTGYSDCFYPTIEMKAVAIKVDRHGKTVAYHTTVGGTNTGRSEGLGIVVDEAGSAYIVGETFVGGITLVNPIQPNPGGGPSYITDAFIVKLLPDVLPTTFALESSRNPVPFGEPVTFTATVPGVGGTVTLSANGVAVAQTPLTSNGSRTTFTLATLPPGLHSIAATWMPVGGPTSQTSSPLLQTVGELVCP